MWDVHCACVSIRLAVLLALLEEVEVDVAHLHTLLQFVNAEKIVTINLSLQRKLYNLSLQQTLLQFITAANIVTIYHCSKPLVAHTACCVSLMPALRI